MHFVYLHGFASGPSSTKGRYFQQRFSELGLTMAQPDLNAPSFTDLTLSSQLAVIAQTLAGAEGPVTLIGSSLGGLLAVLMAMRDARVERLVLMCPAFRFHERWSARLGEAGLHEWQHTGKLAVWHHAYRAECNLRYAFLEDAWHYDERTFDRSIPVLILHGTRDEVVPPESSQEFARHRSNVEVVWFDSDHGMTDVLPEIWKVTADFLQLGKAVG